MSVILGQSRPLEILRAALRSGRFHHAWIFSGPVGVGKFTTALALARVLLDPNADADFMGQRPQPSNSIQNQIDNSAHPDLHIIRKELALYSDDRASRERKQLNIPINLLRERVIGGKVGEVWHDAAAYRTAAMGHGKVFIIDEAQLLAREAQNVMLKTLEEPPPQTYFFLITSQPQRLLSTIHSRCQHVRFNRLDDKAMEQWLRDTIAGRLNPGALQWIKQFAEGSPGMAQLAMEYDFARWQKIIEPMAADLVRGQFPVAMGQTLADLIDEFALAWVKNHKNASKDAANKDGARHMFSLLASHFRAELARTAGDPSHEAYVERIMEMIDRLRQAERELDSNVSLRLLLENLVVQWTSAGIRG